MRRESRRKRLLFVGLGLLAIALAGAGIIALDRDRSGPSSVSLSDALLEVCVPGTQDVRSDSAKEVTVRGTCLAKGSRGRISFGAYRSSDASEDAIGVRQGGFATAKVQDGGFAVLESSPNDFKVFSSLASRGWTLVYRIE